MAKKKSEPQADVAVIMGSDSDLKDMEPCLRTLEEFGVSCMPAIASAHRTHEYLKRQVSSFEQNGGRVVIAAAGGAAHLPGVVAALTMLPVIGVPMGSKLLGIDSLLSIAQMPSGMPVATVAVGGAKNAALLAVQILALSDKTLESRYGKFRAQQSESVVKKSRKLKMKGYADYFGD